MRKLLEATSLAVTHLLTLDEVFRSNYVPYREWVERMENLPLYDELRKEVYAGGKKRGPRGYNRQMILGDLIEYILTGRGYCFAVRGEEEFKSFIEILMHAANLLILLEDISVDVELRVLVLRELERKLSGCFFEEDEQKWKYQSIIAYKDIIARGKGNEHEEFLDSILPKRVGIVPEILVYCWLIRKKYGYVVPLLLAQRLLGKMESITPPDFLLIRSKGEIFGLEVGVGKERQISSFSSITGIPIFTVGIGTVEQPQPYRCDRCLKWIVYCPYVINLCKLNQDEVGEVQVSCASCSYQKDTDITTCPYAVYYGEAHNFENKIVRRRYHYQCVKDDEIVKANIEKAAERYLVAPVPTVYGIEHLSEE